VIDSLYNKLTAGNDSSTAFVKAYHYGRGGQSLWDAITSIIKTNDDVVGNGVEDRIVGSFYPGFNWFVKGDNNITNGWINLVMY
jgi:hypothetical protein